MIVLDNKIKKKYNIQDEEEKLSFSEANDFIKDIFGAGWAHPYSFRDEAIRRGYAELGVKGTLKKKWLISYKNIMLMMNEKVEFYKNTPVYQKNNRTKFPLKNNFIDWKKR
jgi:hypothetical protein